MHKLPVFRTAGNAIGFTLYNSFTIFRLAWFPFAALIVTEGALACALILSMGEKIDGLPSPFKIGEVLESALALNIIVLVLQAIVIAAVAVSIHRVILFGDRRPGHYFNFSFSKTEFLYILMGVISTIMFVTVLGVFFAPLMFLMASGDPLALVKSISDNPQNLPKVLDGRIPFFLGTYFIAAIFIIYLSLRLAVWPPAVVARNRLSLGHAWRLTRGNVWRLIGAIVLTFGWIYILVAFATAAFFFDLYKNRIPSPPDVPAVTTPAPAAKDPSIGIAPETKVENTSPPATSAPSGDAKQPTPEAKPATPAPDAVPRVVPETFPRDRDVVRDRFERMLAPFTLLIWLIELFVYIYFTALAVALVSYSYKALNGYDAREPIPTES
jgi:hypothetical protein